jgi:RNA polymerase sigma factor (sigma-70 family)
LRHSFKVFFLLVSFNSVFAALTEPNTESPPEVEYCRRSLAQKVKTAADREPISLLDAERERFLVDILWQGREELRQILAKTGGRPKARDLKTPLQSKAGLARKEMILANTGLVFHIAKRFRGRAEHAELIGEGNLGLITAVDRVDPSFNAQFQTYAGYWIRHFMREAVRTHYSTIPVTDYSLRKWIRSETIRQRMMQDRGRPLTLHQSLEEMGILDYQGERIRETQTLRNLERFSAPTKYKRPDFREPSQPGRAVDEALAHDEELERLILSLREVLDPRERCLIELYFGLNGDEPLSCRTAAERVGVSRETIRLAVLRALAKLNRAMEPQDSSADPGK